MNTNEVIRAFDINAITRDDNNLYLKFTIDRNKASIKRAKFIKVCIESSRRLNPKVKDKNSLLLDDLTSDFKSKSSPLGLNLYRFEDNILDLTIEEDEVTNFKEYFLSIPIIKIRNIVGGLFGYFSGEEKPHTFKVYILDKNKSILEKYDYPSDYKINDYSFNKEADGFVFNTLESSIDLIFTPYNANYIGGPYLRVNEEILDNPALDLTKISLQIAYNEKNYNFMPIDSQSLTGQTVQDSQAINNLFNQQSQKAISDGLENSEDLDASIFKREFLSVILIQSNNQFITDLFTKFYNNRLSEDTVDYKVIYEDNEIIKSKNIDRSTVESLYFSYYQKNKSEIINNLMKSPPKINISNIDSHLGFSILFKNFLRHMIPTSDSQTSFKIYKIQSGTRIEVRDLYTSISFDEDLKISTYSNRGFLLESIYNKPNKNSEFFIKFSRPVERIIVCFNNIEIFSSQIARNTTISSQQNLNPFFNDIDVFRRQTFSNLMQSSQIGLTPTGSSDLFYSINTCFKNPRISADRRIMFDFDKSELSKNKETAARFGYNVNNNDNLDIEIINNSIAIFTVSNSDTFVESTIPIRVKNILENNQSRAFLPVNFLPERIEIKSIIQPFEMADLLISGSGSDDNKETISDFLNQVTVNRYTSIAYLVENVFFKSQSESFVIEETFRILGNTIIENSFLINNEIDLDSLLDSVIEIEEDSGI